MSHERPDVESAHTSPTATPDEGEVRTRRSARHTHHAEHDEVPPEKGGYAVWILAGAMLVLALARPKLTGLLEDHEALQAWLTVFVSIALQALPFLVLGVALSAAVAVLVPPEALSRWLPKNPAAAVPVAGLSGMALPGCECASVPIAGALVSRGIQPAVALTFLLAAPAINPIVLASTAVAFAGDWRVVLARFIASLVTAIVVGWIWLRLGKDNVIRMPRRARSDGSRLARFVDEVSHDVLHAGGYLVVGAAVAATVNVVVPRSWIDTLAGNLLVSIIVLALFAVIVAICSEADAFVAASLSAFPMTARLVFMVVGPVLDVKLFALQVATFGRKFAMVFAPLTFVVAVLVAAVTGMVLLP